MIKLYHTNAGLKSQLLRIGQRKIQCE